jgi:two-component system, OmpR family, sensor histidine kinase KdpD
VQPVQCLGVQAHDTGVGLGLAVASGFVRLVGGELTLDDTPGGGLTVVLALRCAEVPEPAVHTQASILRLPDEYDL